MDLEGFKGIFRDLKGFKRFFWIFRDFEGSAFSEILRN